MARMERYCRRSDGIEERMKTLVLGLGNELLSDDGLGLLAVRKLKDENTLRADFVECSLSGMALLDIFVGYHKAIIVDAVKTGRGAPGTIYELNPEDLGPVFAPSPHYSGLPELLAIAERLGLDFPGQIKIFAMEVDDPYTIGGGLTEPVSKALGDLVDKVRMQISDWEKVTRDA
jgi:hydrogenase maturation protease